MEATNLKKKATVWGHSLRNDEKHAFHERLSGKATVMSSHDYNATIQRYYRGVNELGIKFIIPIVWLDSEQKYKYLKLNFWKTCQRRPSGHKTLDVDGYNTVQSDDSENLNWFGDDITICFVGSVSFYYVVELL